MKFSALEEYGLRCLLLIGRVPAGKSCTIPEISRVGGLSSHNVAKLLRILRQGGFIQSVRGQAGGYTLAKPPSEIIVGEVLAVLGGRLFEPGFCSEHSGMDDLCPHHVDCSIRSLWSTVQQAVDQVLTKTTLQDLLSAHSDLLTQIQDTKEPFEKIATMA